MHNKIRISLNAGSRFYFAKKKCFYPSYCSDVQKSTSQVNNYKYIIIKYFSLGEIKKNYSVSGGKYNMNWYRTMTRIVFKEGLMKTFTSCAISSLQHFLAIKKLEWAGQVWRAEDSLVKEVIKKHWLLYWSKIIMFNNFSACWKCYNVQCIIHVYYKNKLKYCTLTTLVISFKKRSRKTYPHFFQF